MKHTKGPWVVERSTIYDSEVVYINTNTGTWKQGEICVLYGNLDTNLANARLIAAAPDLLEALTALVDRCYMNDRFPDLTGPAEEAIQKARGQ